MTSRTSFALLALALWIAPSAPARAALALRSISAPEAPALVPAAQPSALIAESLKKMPVEPIPIGEFGPFGVPGGDPAAQPEIAPAAPAVPPPSGLLDLRSNPEPEDAVAPVAP